MRRRRIVLAGGAAIAMIGLSWLAGSLAIAKEPSPAWNDLLAIEGHLGLGTPVGLAGLAVDLTPHPHVSLNVGAGRGLYALQFAAMARVRPFFVTPNLAPGIGAGVSGGDTGTPRLLFDHQHLRFEQAMWVNGEVFLEFRRGRVHLRPFLGYARRLHHSGCTYVNTFENWAQPCSEVDPNMVAQVDNVRWIYYLGGAIGWSLF